MKRGGVHRGIANANRLHAMDLEVWTTVAPAWIREKYPEMESLYEKIVKYGDTRYYKKMLEKYSGDGRIKTLPYDLS